MDKNYKVRIYYISQLNIEINLMDISSYIYSFPKTDDYVKYGIKNEGTKKCLVIRSPFVIYNRTSSAYKLRLSKGSIEVVTLDIFANTCYPLHSKELLYKFSISQVTH